MGGDQAVQKLRVVLRADFYADAAFGMSATVGIDVNADNLRFGEELGPHPGRRAIENADLDQVKLCVAQRSKAFLVMTKIIAMRQLLSLPSATPIPSGGKV